ncbi:MULTISPECIES: HK97-gp10 family putative phage morphogenesis protein [Vibrio]|uniref:HK97-gp10 family putative phage morphogenesis protein n=1 Tax=Vibrio TaxID=662 RepID=UPI001CDB7AB5|nr:MULTISPECIES: HK97-gp10 family putative phage morphogenesis protein [Vibrio]MCA2455830.1 hypothetical protein [Vibrio alginolyticus]MCA2461097.1 hypothetical protein [Vibrio alginolyticus]MDW2267476.1 hypothetical protein [Vibrio sp. 1394]MDW2294732.1 hypothetical protein [Vibrio sp. 1404]
MQIDNWDISGLKELEEALTELGEKAGLNALRKASRAALEKVKTDMAEGAGYDEQNVDGEHMRDSIKITTKKLDRKGSGANNALSARVGPSKEHAIKAIAQEYGTYKQEAKPFMRPAFAANKHHTVSTFRTVLAIEIKKAIKKQAK